MATKADKKRWDDLHAAYAKADEAVFKYESELRAKYGHHFDRSWLNTGQRKKLDVLRERRDKIGEKIIDLIVRVSPRGDTWLHGVPSFWLREELTWEDAIRPKDEPLSVVVPGAYGYPDGYMKAKRTMTKKVASRSGEKEIPVANPGDYDENAGLFQFQFGAYADTAVYVWADSFDSAEEIAIEWADDNARGVFVTLTEDDLKEAAEDLGIEWDEAWSDGGAVGRKEFGQAWNPFDDRDYEKIVERAEADLIVIGWTTLKSGTHVISYEVHAHEVTDTDEIEEVAERSREEEEPEEEDEEPSETELPTAENILRDLGPHLTHEGHDAEKQSKVIAKLIAKARDHESVDDALDNINELLDAHGIEAIRGDHYVDNFYHDIVALYVNMGDSYAATILYETEEEQFLVTSFGDWVERNQDKYKID